MADLTKDQASDVVSRAGPRKRALVAELSEKLGRATSAVLADYRGLTVKELEELRGSLHASSIDFHIVKNTLARRAASDAGVSELTGSFSGPVGIAIGYDDLSAPARLMQAHFRAQRRLPIVSGWIKGRVLDADSVKTLAELPPREVLLSQLAGTLNAPTTRLAGGLNSILTNFAATLDAYRVSLEAAS